MQIALCILAKDESGKIGKLLAQLLKQSLVLEDARKVTAYVVANGCSDDTAGVARSFFEQFRQRGVSLQVEDLRQGGKSRTWNRAVHELIDQRTDVIVFTDADIQFVDNLVLAEMVDRVTSNSDLMVAAGYPVKDIVQRSRSTMLDRISLRISSETRHTDAVSGQLYAAKADCLREIWLPDETPGEDGFLNAMVNTNGFTRPHQAGRVRGHTRPTHFYEALGPASFIKHEKRLIVGTMINIWIFEYLISLKLKEPAGPLIRDWNASRPGWVEEIVASSTAGKRWVIRSELLKRRLMLSDRKALSDLRSVALSIVATFLTVPPAVMANQRLKRTGSASSW